MANLLESLLRASPENPSTSLANPAAWLQSALGALPSFAGRTVSVDTAQQLSTVNACVRVIAEDTAKSRAILYKATGSTKTRAQDHPLFGILRHAANPELSAFTFWETAAANVATWGNFYAEVERDNGGFGDIIALWPLLPNVSHVERRRLSNGQLVKVLFSETADGRRLVLFPGEYLHVPGLGNGFMGRSIIAQARQAIGLGLAQEESGARLFSQGNTPIGVLSVPDELSPKAKERLRKEWSDMHSGLDNAHRVAVLEAGLEWQNLGMPNTDAQWLEGRKFQTLEICRFYRMAPHKVQSALDSSATYTNQEASATEHVGDVVLPMANRIEGAINLQLLRELERRQGLGVEFLLDALLRGDVKTRHETYAAGRQWGYYSANDVLAMESRNGIGEQGDVYLVPANMLDARDIRLEPTTPAPGGDEGDEGEGDEGEGDEGDEGEGDLESGRSALIIPGRTQPGGELRGIRSASSRQRQQQAHQRIFYRAAEQIVGREVKALTRLLGQAFDEANPAAAFLRSLERFYADFPTAIDRALLPVLLTYAEVMRNEIAGEIGGETGMAPELETMVRDYLASFDRRYIESSQSQVSALLAANPVDEVRELLLERFGQWGERRPTKVAANESVRSAGAFSKVAYVLGGVVVIRWVAFAPNCPLCDELDGREVGITESFVPAGGVVDPGVEGTAPITARESISHGPLHGGCDCTIVAG